MTAGTRESGFATIGPAVTTPVAKGTHDSPHAEAGHA